MKRVLLLHTGGTLGMRAAPAHSDGNPRRPEPLRPDAYADAIIERVPEITRLANIETRILCNLDSSDIGPDEWAAFANEIATARNTGNYDGFVIIHGTDTMAYTASALSFALAGLDRPVVLTGSQRPLGEIRTDARRNLVDAVDLATRDIPEVGICFDGRLLRGNRATKGDAWSYAAFASPACAPLARLGLDVEIAPHVRRPDPTRAFECLPHFDPSIVVYRVVPGVSPTQLQRLVDREVRGVILLAFGVGNAPAIARPLAPVVEALTRRGVLVLVVTQAWSGAVDLTLYENGVALARAGALSGGDLGIEAATIKLMHALALHPNDVSAQAAYLRADIAGERKPGV